MNEDIPENSVYAGIPAKFICTFNEYVEKAKVYSTEFRELYNIDKITNMSDELAQQIYKNFLKAKKENEEV